MAMTPERSKQLHNFSLPCLKWGTQRLLRCVNTDPPSNQNQNPITDHRRSDNPKRKNEEKFIGDLSLVSKKLKVSIFNEDDASVAAEASNAAIRPWNLRTRRAACKEPPAPPPPPPPPIPAREEGRRFFDFGSSSPSPVKENQNQNQNQNQKKKKIVIGGGCEKVKFSVSLSKEEVERDFWALVGTRPPRRPKKRPRIVQRQLDTILPGMWLGEITAESYKVSEVPE